MFARRSRPRLVRSSWEVVSVAAQTGAALAAGVAAFAAWVSAYQSRGAIELANRPFVWPALTAEIKGGDSEYKVWAFKARLHNDGPGVAIDVRWSVYVP